MYVTNVPEAASEKEMHQFLDLNMKQMLIAGDVAIVQTFSVTSSAGGAQR